MFWMFVAALWIAMLVSPIALLIAFLPTGRECPRCSAETLPLQLRALRPLARVVQRRWCLSCGWGGVVRRVEAPISSAPEPAESAREADDEAWRGGQEA